MKNIFLFLCVLLLNISCSEKRKAVIGETEFQQKLNSCRLKTLRKIASF